MYTVNVLISTYNGEKYLEQQINSVLNQDYPIINIYIRDDGSTDNTVNILEKYSKYNNVHICYGENIGFLYSFKKLLEMSELGDLWAFCDQDDIWYKDKIRRAVEWFDSNNDTIPILYHCSYFEFFDFKKEKNLYYRDISAYDFKRSITENIFSGFASVINSQMRNAMLKGNWDNIDYHDCWMTMIATAFGKFYFDKYIGAEHRRMKNSVSMDTTINRIRWFVNCVKDVAPLKKRNIEFYKCFGKELDSSKLEEILPFVSTRNSTSNIIKKSFYNGRWRSKVSSEISIRLLMLVNKV